MDVNLADNTDLLTLIQAQSASTTVTGSAVDLKDYDGEAIVVLNSAAMSAADTLDGKIQHSDDGSTGWTDVSGAAFAQVTDAAASSQKLKLKTNECKRFVRGVGTLAGSTIAAVFGMQMLVQKRAS